MKMGTISALFRYYRLAETIRPRLFGRHGFLSCVRDGVATTSAVTGRIIAHQWPLMTLPNDEKAARLPNVVLGKARSIRTFAAAVMVDGRVAMEHNGNTLLCACSTCKVAAATAAMSVRGGVVDLDLPVAAYANSLLFSVPTKARSITSSGPSNGRRAYILGIDSMCHSTEIIPTCRAAKRG